MKRIDKYWVCNFGIYMAGLSMVLGGVDRLRTQDCLKQTEDLGVRVVNGAGKGVRLNLPPILPKFKK